MNIFQDKYTNFSFDGRSSSLFKVYVTNDHEIEIALTPSFNDKFVVPSYANTRYYTNTSVDRLDLSVNCIAIDITMNEWRAITEWLSPLKIGKLSFDFNTNKYYIVKLNQQPDVQSWVVGNKNIVEGDRSNIVFNLSFTTVDDYAAISDVLDINLETFDNDNLHLLTRNEYYFPQFHYSKTNTSYLLFNTGAYDMYPNIKIISQPSLDIAKPGYVSIKNLEVCKNNITCYQYIFNVDDVTENQKYIDIIGRSGTLTFNKKLLESTTNTISGVVRPYVKSSNNNGPFTIGTGKPEMFIGTAKINKNTNILSITLDPDENILYMERLMQANGRVGVFIFQPNDNFQNFYQRKNDLTPFSKYRFMLTVPEFNQNTNVLTMNNGSGFEAGGDIGLVEERVYVSLCDYSEIAIRELDFDGINDKPLSGSIYLQTRGAI